MFSLSQIPLFSTIAVIGKDRDPLIQRLIRELSLTNVQHVEQTFDQPKNVTLVVAGSQNSLSQLLFTSHCSNRTLICSSELCSKLNPVDLSNFQYVITNDKEQHKRLQKIFWRFAWPGESWIVIDRMSHTVTELEPGQEPEETYWGSFVKWFGF